jgi:putative flippase GtrA
MTRLVGLSKFALVGTLATLIHIVVFAVLVEATEASPVEASVPAFLVAMLVSYAFNRAWTFRASARHRAALPRYASIAALGLSLNVLIMYVTVNVLQWWYVSSLALVVLVVPFTTFHLNRCWTFKTRLAP